LRGWLGTPEAAEGDDGAHDAVEAQAAPAAGDVEGDEDGGGLGLVQRPEPHGGGTRAGVVGGEVAEAEALESGGVLEVVDGGVATVDERTLPGRFVGFGFCGVVVRVKVDGEEAVAVAVAAAAALDGDGGDEPPLCPPRRRRGAEKRGGAEEEGMKGDGGSNPKIGGVHDSG